MSGGPKKGKDPWVKWFPGDFLHGVSELEASEGWVYVIVLNQIYDKEGPVAYDAARLARRCRLRRDIVEKAITTLIDFEKLTLIDGMLSNPKAERMVLARQNKSESAAEAARTRWEGAEGKDKEIKDGNDASALQKPCEPDAILDARDQKLEPEKKAPPPPEAGGDEFVFGGMAPDKPKRDRKPRATTSRITSAVAEEAVRLWNETAKRNDLVGVRWPINDTRLKKLKKRLEDGGIERWMQALDRIERSSFLCGESSPRNLGDAPWQAGFDFLLQPSSWDKLHEGTYRQNRTPPQVAADPANWPSERWERVHTRYRTSGSWPDGAGPKPDEPGYLGPKYFP